MPLVTVRTAAELTGKDRTTINRAITKGLLSATKSDLGHYLIDPAELERVYGTLHTPATSSATSHPDEPQPDAHPQHSPEAFALLREMLDRERASYERDRRAWEEERAFFRDLIAKQTDQLKLLTDQRQQEAHRPWWRRLLGVG